MLQTKLLDEQDIELLRKGNGSYNSDGDWVPATEVSSTIQCIVQPYRQGSKQFVLPEGIKSEDTRIIYTTFPLRNTNEFYKYNADILVIDGLRYEIQSVADYSKYVKSIINLHYQCLAVLETKAKNS